MFEKGNFNRVSLDRRLPDDRAVCNIRHILKVKNDRRPMKRRQLTKTNELSDMSNLMRQTREINMSDDRTSTGVPSRDE